MLVYYNEVYKVFAVAYYNEQNKLSLDASFRYMPDFRNINGEYLRADYPNMASLREYISKSPATIILHDDGVE